MNLRDLKRLLGDNGLRPLAGRSQNFLLDNLVVQKMVTAAGVEKGTSVLEIGPGPGILTEVLLASNDRVVAIEIDPGLCRLLRQRFGEHPNFQLI